MAFASGMTAGLKRAVSDGLLLFGPEATARRYTPEQGTLVRELHRGATDRVIAARDLRDARTVGAAAAVLREALRLAAAALIVSRDPSEPALARPEAELLEQAIALAGASRDLAPALDAARRLARTTDPLGVDRAPPVVAVQELDAVDAVIRALLDPVEPRTPRRLVAARWLRIASFALCLLGLALFGLVRAFAPRNVALGKAVSASGYWPGSPPADELVNGSHESPYGSATQKGKDGWFSVDLARPHAIDRVVVVNRQDKYARETPPLALELSDDGEHYVEVTRFLGTSAGEHYVWKGLGRVARHVRVRRVDRNFAICEIEVYGRPR